VSPGINGYTVINRLSDYTLLKQFARLEGVFKIGEVTVYVLLSASRSLKLVASGEEELTALLSPLINILS
jgi:hypothetical protein